MENRRSFLKKSGLLLAASSLPITALSIERKSEKKNLSNVSVILNVDTTRISKPDVNPYCNFGQPSTIMNEDFTIEVNVGDTISWEGISSSSSFDAVNIISINHEGGQNIFDRNLLAGDNGNPEKVVGTVLNPTPEGKEYKYTIAFTVYNNGVKRNGTYRIDPIIKVK